MEIDGVFAGGGVKGIAFAGTAAAAEQAGVRFRRVAGTSAGAIVAGLLAAGYRAAELLEILSANPFASLLKPPLLHKFGRAGSALHVLMRNGLYSAEPLTDWLRGLLSAKQVATFADLQPGSLRVIASDLTRGRLVILPDDLRHYGMEPELFSVAEALAMSARIPYFFEPATLGRSVIVDGALLSNFPIWLFTERLCNEYSKPREDVPVIGFRFREREQFHEIGGPLSMLAAIAETMMSAHDQHVIERETPKQRVPKQQLIERQGLAKVVEIQTPDGISATQFQLGDSQLQALYQAGFAAAMSFFQQNKTPAAVIRGR